MYIIWQNKITVVYSHYTIIHCCQWMLTNSENGSTMKLDTVGAGRDPPLR